MSCGTTFGNCKKHGVYCRNICPLCRKGKNNKEKRKKI